MKESTMKNAAELVQAGMDAEDTAEDAGKGKAKAKVKKIRPLQEVIWIAFKVVLLDKLLGSNPNMLELWHSHIASKTKDAEKKAEEEKTISAEDKENIMKSKFHKDPLTGLPILYNYYLLGMCKEFLAHECEREGSLATKLGITKWSHKTFVDANVSCYPRQIKLFLPQKDNLVEWGEVSRMVRCETMQGPRVALKTSEAVPEYTMFKLKFRCMSQNAAEVVRGAMKHGEIHGLGEWRNAGWGRFVCKEIDASLVAGDEMDQKALDVLNAD